MGNRILYKAFDGNCTNWELKADCWFMQCRKCDTEGLSQKILELHTIQQEAVRQNLAGSRRV